MSATLPTDVFALTADLVNRPSVSFEEAPFVDWLESELRACDHLTVDRVGDNLVARTMLGREQRLILAGHTDTVPVAFDEQLPGGSNAAARIEGDTLWGVGSADMKGGLACFFDVARTVPDPRVDLTFVFYAREEVGQEHNGLQELAELRPELLEGDCAILGEPTDGAIEAGCQGAMRVEVVLTGARAHTARPWMGRNAIHRMGELLTTLEAYEARTPEIDGCVYREAVQAVNIEGGVAGNVVPDRVAVRIHHRYAPDRSAAEAEAFLRELVAPFMDDGDESTDEFNVLDSSAACPPSLTHPLLMELRDGFGTGKPLEVRSKLGWTDVARFAQLGVPATNFGSGDATVAHTKMEHLHRASIERTATALRALVEG